MKKSLFIYSKISVAIIALFVFVIPSAGATVGGPTHIGVFNYNKADESVYYILSSQSGRGCPPELYKISLENEAVTRVYSCDQGEQLRGDVYSPEGGPVIQEILKITNGFKDLTPISLPKNNIQVDVSFVRTESIESEPNFVIKSHFTAAVFQNGIKIDEFPIVGCTKEQPFTFGGYAIPGFEKKIVLLLSTKSDCWEGGYTGESLYVVGGVQLINKTHVNEYKSYSRALVPSENTLVIFERDTVTPSNETPATGTSTTSDSEFNSNATFFLVAIIALIIGLILGQLFGKRR